MRETLANSKPRLYIEMHGAGIEAKSANAKAVVELLVESGYFLRHVETGRPVTAEMADVALEGHLYCRSSAEEALGPSPD